MSGRRLQKRSGSVDFELQRVLREVGFNFLNTRKNVVEGFFYTPIHKSSCAFR